MEKSWQALSWFRINTASWVWWNAVDFYLLVFSFHNPRLFSFLYHCWQFRCHCACMLCSVWWLLSVASGTLCHSLVPPAERLYREKAPSDASGKGREMLYFMRMSSNKRQLRARANCAGFDSETEAKSRFILLSTRGICIAVLFKYGTTMLISLVLPAQIKKQV